VTRTVEDLGWEVERRWTQLGEHSRPGEMRIVDLPQSVAGVPVYLGVGADGARLLVPFAKDEHRAFRAETRSRGIELQARQLEQEGENRWFLDVVCTRTDLRWLFSSFVADILLRVRRHPGASPVAIVKTCFIAWRALFAAAERRLTVKQLAGLFGELHLLDRLIAQSSSAVTHWRGPLRESHDFVSVGLDVEVKTTLSGEDDVVHVHGLDQLAAPDDGRLYLAHLRVEVPSSDGEAVPDVVDRLREADATGRLTALLHGAGYHDEHRATYVDLTFKLVDERWYAVDEGFPRLTAASFPGAQVPLGLSEFRYSLDLSTVPVLPLGAGQVSELVEAMVA
jgi:hypothetical protein